MVNRRKERGNETIFGTAMTASWQSKENVEHSKQLRECVGDFSRIVSHMLTDMGNRVEAELTGVNCNTPGLA